MHIAVFGARGSVGHRIVTEALARHHDVTAVVRRPEQIDELDPDAIPYVADATDIGNVTELAYQNDVIVGATRPPSGQEADLVSVAKGLLDAATIAGARVVLAGGAGSLLVPGTQRNVIDDPRYLHPAGRPIAQACSDQLDACRAHAKADWTYLSPAASLQPGQRTGHYRLGTDELVVDASGESRISIEDLAVALLDELEHPQHRRTRFTAAY